MNNVSFFGCLEEAPRLSGMPGRDICEFWLVVKGRRDSHTLYVRVIAFRGLAVRLVEELCCGDQVAVSGHLRSERWPGPRRLYAHSVIARDVQRAAESGVGEQE